MKTKTYWTRDHDGTYHAYTPVDTGLGHTELRATIPGIGAVEIGKSGWCTKTRAWVGRHASWCVSVTPEGAVGREPPRYRRTLREAKYAIEQRALAAQLSVGTRVRIEMTPETLQMLDDSCEEARAANGQEGTITHVQCDTWDSEAVVHVELADGDTHELGACDVRLSERAG